uniref:Uncharacterized protein n=1 Tax=Setaria italica TaxID=4555 RepID=K3XJM3_SETIT
MQVKRILEEFLNIIPEEYSVQRSDLDDFLVEFSLSAIAERILHSHLPSEALFQLIWRRCLTSLQFRVLNELRGIPAHAQNVETTQIALDFACSDLVEASCIHLDLVPIEKLIFIPEPSTPYVGCGLFLKPHELIHSKHDGLWYSVHIRIVDVQDWNIFSDSFDDGTPPDNHDSSEDEDYPGFSQCSRKNPWPKKTQFIDEAGGSGGGPSLGLDWGSCSPRRQQGSATVVAECPVASPSCNSKAESGQDVIITATVPEGGITSRTTANTSEVQGPHASENNTDDKEKRETGQEVMPSSDKTDTPSREHAYEKARHLISYWATKRRGFLALPGGLHRYPIDFPM